MKITIKRIIETETGSRITLQRDDKGYTIILDNPRTGFKTKMVQEKTKARALSRFQQIIKSTQYLWNNSI